ncbi:MAG TPA: energy-coupling factor transporter transmembrane component T [Bacillota bacterium]|nr:energy-coupling factor transporter transmembrane component T [Bacillota bacterium]HPT87537.1 energy-coupling factor transporter transmembrane component T [Bacillota bacterium]
MATIGTYYPADSFWHHCDPRSKFGVVLALIAVLLGGGNTGLVVGCLMVPMLFVTSQISLKIAGQILRKFKWLIGVTFLANLFFPWPFPDFWQGLQSQCAPAVLVTIRLSALLVIAMWLSLVTRPTAIVDGLNRLLKPFDLLKLPIEELSLVMMLVLRFIPELMAESETIMIAQRIRGIEPKLTWRTSHTWIQSTMIPLVIGSIRKSAAMAIAMEARGYRPGAPRTSMEELKLKWSDWVVMALCAGLVVWMILF